MSASAGWSASRAKQAGRRFCASRCVHFLAHRGGALLLCRFARRRRRPRTPARIVITAGRGRPARAELHADWHPAADRRGAGRADRTGDPRGDLRPRGARPWASTATTRHPPAAAAEDGVPDRGRAGRRTPTDEELQAFLARHPDRFQRRAAHELSPGLRRAASAARKRREPKRGGSWRGCAPPAPCPDRRRSVIRSLLPTSTSSPRAGDVARDLRAGLRRERCGPRRSGSWQGRWHPATGCTWSWSRERIEGRLPALAEIREAVSREWQSEQRRQLNEKFYVALRARYTVDRGACPRWARRQRRRGRAPIAR